MGGEQISRDMIPLISIKKWCPTKAKIIYAWMSRIQPIMDVLPDMSSSWGLWRSNDAPVAFFMRVSMETDCDCRCNHQLFRSMETHLTATCSHAYVKKLVSVGCVQHKCDYIHFDVWKLLFIHSHPQRARRNRLSLGMGLKCVSSQFILSICIKLQSRSVLPLAKCI